MNIDMSTKEYAKEVGRVALWCATFALVSAALIGGVSRMVSPAE